MPEFRVELVNEVDPAILRDVSGLLPQVSSRAAPLTEARFRTVVSNPATHVLVARSEESVIGMALLLVSTTLTGQYGVVQEVAVDEAVRGQHIATRLLTNVLELAAALDLDFVELTSRPAREAANGLYRSLGFRLRETNVYRHWLDGVTEGAN